MSAVTRLFAALKVELDAAGFGDVVISGTVRKPVKASSGHVYFALEDGQSRIACVLFRGLARSVDLADGQTVTMQGAVEVYGPKGDIQFQAKEVTTE